MQDNAERARDLLAARREHSKGQGNFPTPEPHMGLRDERPEDREPRELPKARDDRSAPKGDVPVGQEDRNPDLVTRVPRGGGREPNPPGGMELVVGSLERPKREARPARPNARRSSAAKREVTRGERPRRRGRVEPGTAAKDAEKNATRRAGESRARTPTATPVRAARTTRVPMQPPSRASGNTQRTAARARGSTKPLTKRAAKSAGPDATQSTAQGGKKKNRRTSAGRGRAGRR